MPESDFTFAFARANMPSIRNYIEPAKHILAGRLDQLCSTLEDLGARLRATIANAVGETITGIVRDAALVVLNDLAQHRPEHRRVRLHHRQRHLPGYAEGDITIVRVVLQRIGSHRRITRRSTGRTRSGYRTRSLRLLGLGHDGRRREADEQGAE